MTDTSTLAEDIPEGFVPMPSYGPFSELVGPLYEKLGAERTVIGMRIADKHRNRGEGMHGGMYLMLADSAMTRAASLVRPADMGAVTSTLSSEFIAPGLQGEWIEAEVEVLRQSRRMIFLTCRVCRTGDNPAILFHASATFHIIKLRQ